MCMLFGIVTLEKRTVAGLVCCCYMNNKETVNCLKQGAEGLLA